METSSVVRAYSNIEFLAKQMVEGFITGLHKSPFHGFSVEFAEHRLYNTGESTRHIDWKVFAKTDKLFTRRYEEETNLRCHLLLDVSSSMFYPQGECHKIKFSTMAAACIMVMLQKQRDAVSLTLFSDKIELQTPLKSTPGHIHKLFLDLQNTLSNQPNLQKTSIPDVLHQVAEKAGKRSLIVLFSDMFDKMEDTNSLFSSLQHFKHKMHEVILFHVMDKKTELDFDFENKPYEFIDIETNDKITLNPALVKAQYQSKINKFHDELKLKCAQFKIDFIEVDAQDDFDVVLKTYLSKRSKMH